MARTRAYYRGVVRWCKISRIKLGQGFSERWCVHHAQWVLDCLECGRDFHSDRSHTRYCSNACSQAAYRKRKKEAS